MNEDTRLKLIKDNEGIIYSIILKYKRYFDIQDLYQVGVIGLLKAADNFNDSMNTKFSSYAYSWILGEVMKYISNSKILKISRDSQVVYKKILEAKEILSQKFMREPSLLELSCFLEIDEGIIENIINANKFVNSLDDIITSDGEEFKLYEKIGYNDINIENLCLNMALDELSSFERKIIEFRYYNGLSQQETAKKLGMYQVDVSRKEKKILCKLKEKTY